MRIKEKRQGLIVRGVVIPCGLSDKTGDKPQTKEDIKKIFTNYLAHDTDVQHSFVKNFGVYGLENTLTDVETTIAGQTVPANSWISSQLVINPEIQAMIRDKFLNGFSLGAVGDELLNENQNFLNKSLRYEHLKDSEDLNPLFISFVKEPANGFNWEVYDYDSFLAKSLDYNFGDEDNMPENNKEIGTPEGYVSEGFVERLFGGLMTKSNETPEKEEKEEEKDEIMENKETTDISNKELLEQLPGAVATAVVEALKELSKEEPPKKEEKEDETLEKSEKEKNPKDEEKEEKMEKGSSNHNEEQIMTKSTGKIEHQTTTPVKTVSFLNSETRDRFGRNKKYL